MIKNKLGKAALTIYSITLKPPIFTMFTSKSKTSQEEYAACSIIAQGTVITGDIESNGDIRIDGSIKGNIRSKARIIIGANALVEGNVQSKDADIFGHVKGHLNITELLQLKNLAVIDGDINTGKLQMEHTVSFNGQCKMGANVVELNSSTGLPVAVNE